MKLNPIDHSEKSGIRRRAALKIYKSQILPEAQNPEKQILYWIEHSRDRIADQFHCLAIQEGRKTIGYLQFSFFVQENIIFFEYLCLAAQGNIGLAPSPAIGSIRDYLAVNFPCDVKIVFEVAHRKAVNNKWKRDHKLVVYFERLGFRTIDFRYEYPVLQSYGSQLSYPADLMINLPSNRLKVQSSELRSVLRCIYFGHYLNWDRPFLSTRDFSVRERFIDKLYNRHIGRAEDFEEFDTYGDDNRSIIKNALRRTSSIKALASHIFGPKLARLCVVAALLIVLERSLGSVWLLIPFVLVGSAVYCLAEDTTASKKLFTTIISRLSVAKLKSS